MTRGLWQALALVVLPCVALVGLESYQVLGRGPAMRVSRELVVHTFDVIGTAQRFDRMINDAVRSQRAFLITANPSYISSYHQSARQAAGLLTRLKQLTADDPAQQQRLTELQHELDVVLADLQHTVDLREQGPVSAAQLESDTNLSRDTMQGVVRIVDSIIATENNLLTERLARSAESERHTTYSALAGAAIGLALIMLGVLLTLMTFRNMRRLVAERQASEERFRLLVDGVADHAIYLLDPQGRVTGWNAGAQRLKGYPANAIVGQHFSRFFTPEDQAAGVPDQMLEQAAKRGKFEGEGWRVRMDGSRFRANSLVTALREPSGRLIGFAKITRDVTERRQQQEALEQARAALAQSQKMEALGQLTGGMAHDFNNFLHVIKNAIEIVQARTRDGDESTARYFEMARRNADRAASVTQRLLAFARQQPLDPKPVSPNKLISGMSDLLRHALGAGVSMETVLGAGVWWVSADTNQLETAILNLVINARDAMNGAGKLTIETANAFLDDAYGALHPDVAPGQYVMIAVTDTGSGMSKEVIAKAFDPFFTTKGPGEGTGLGLSQVFGFVKQSGGHVKIYSELGEGTTVKLYLPRLQAESVAPALDSAPALRDITGEAILVVEDDDDVRAFTAEMLSGLGYRVTAACDGRTALAQLERAGADLLFTDVGLPNGMNGRQLAEEARRRWPHLRVLFTTGYARNAIMHHGRLDPGVDLIIKPFTHIELSRKVRQVLDRPLDDQIASPVESSLRL